MWVSVMPGAALAGALEERHRGLRATAITQTALKLLQPLAGQGAAGAQLVLGFMHHYGSGVSQDDVQAAQWMRKAAEQGNAAAEASLGGMYLEGQGVPKNEDEAVQWLRKGAEQGVPPAQFALGSLAKMRTATPPRP